MPPHWKCRNCGALNKKGKCVKCGKSVSFTADIAFTEQALFTRLQRTLNGKPHNDK